MNTKGFPMRTDNVRFGLVGAGAIGQTYAQAFGRCGHVELVAVCDVDAATAARVAGQHGCAALPNVRALEQAGVEAVVVCTPPNTHPELCVELAELGLHVLCEKPMAIDAGSARRMIAAAHRAGTVLTMASKFRYVNDVVAAKEMIDAGRIGQVVLFENAFTSRVDMTQRWNSKREISGGGVLIDNGTHSVDLMRYFLGPLNQLQVIEGHRTQGLAVEETVRIMAVSESGVMASSDLSWSLNKELPHYIQIYGSDGIILLGWKGSKFRAGKADWVDFGQGYDKLQAFQAQLDNFGRHLRGNEALVINSADGLASVETIEAAYDALHHSHWTLIGPDTASLGATNLASAALN